MCAYLYNMLYWSTANRFLRMLYPAWQWQIQTSEKKIYLSFDDGPHPEITPWVLDQLKNYNAKASFFCIGKNVKTWPAVYERILREGHIVGNHTMNHRNGWKSSDEEYFADIGEAAKYIDSKLFRPPYGRLTRFQGKLLKEAGYEMIMWTVLSGDFDAKKSAAQCWDMVRENVDKGSIVVYHDSEKAWDRLNVVLPQTLEWFSARGYIFEAINMNILKANNRK